MAKKQAQTSVVSPFGHKTDSQAARIDCALTSKPQTVKDIAEAAGVTPGRCRCHLNGLAARKLAVQTKEGWTLAKSPTKKPAKAAPAKPASPLPKATDAKKPSKATKAAKAPEAEAGDATKATKAG